MSRLLFAAARGPYKVLGFEEQPSRFVDDYVVLSRLDYYGDPVAVDQYNLRAA